MIGNAEHPSTGSGAKAQIEQMSHDLVEEGKAAVERFERAAKKPAMGAAIAGATVAGIAALWGVSEAAVGLLAAYGVYRIMRRRRKETATDTDAR